MTARKVLLRLGRRARPFGLGRVETKLLDVQACRELATEIDNALVRHDISPWFPRCIDEANGGFTANYSGAWRPTGDQGKSLVYQSRLTWFAAQVSRRLKTEESAQFIAHARHGLSFLREKMWDVEYGGPFWRLDLRGLPPAGEPVEKYAYGVAFVIYASASLAWIASDPPALAFAQDVFRWLEAHAHDMANGGYHEILDRAGVPLRAGPRGERWSEIGTPYGYKSANTHLHLLEALTELYRAWPDPLVRERLTEIFLLVRDRMFVAPGCLSELYTDDFRPLPGVISYGHDVESAYLLVEASRALGQPDDAETWQKARLLVDNAITFGFDGALGGLYYSGTVFANATALHKVWWAQAEALNAFFLLHERFGADDPRYGSAFVRTWDFIRSRVVDSTHGGWHDTIWLDDRPLPGPKSHDWKDPYHTGRALLNVSAGLWRLTGTAPPALVRK